MENIGELMQQYATKEVLTVIVALATAWVGWRAAVKVSGLAKGYASKASFAGLTSAFLLLAGFGGIGAGIGELASRTGGDKEEEKSTETQLTNEQLVKLATAEKTNNIDDILKYAAARDTAARLAAEKAAESEKEKKTQTLVPTGTTSVSIDAKGNTWVMQTKETAVQVSAKDTKKKPYEELPFDVEEQGEVAAINNNEESIMTTPIAWMAIGIGLASIIGSFGVFTTRKQ